MNCTFDLTPYSIEIVKNKKNAHQVLLSIIKGNLDKFNLETI
jgi:hypothetical protein